MPSPLHMLRSVSIGLALSASLAGAASRLPDEHERGVDRGSAYHALQAPRSGNAALQAELSRGGAWRQFQAQHGPWQAVWNEVTRTPTYAFGPGIRLRGFANEAGAVDRAVRGFMAENPSMFGPDTRDLELAAVVRADQLWHVRYRQTVQGIPVLFSNWGFEVSLDGRVAGFGAEAYRPGPELRTTPRLVAAVAREAAKSGVVFDAATDRVEGQELYILPVGADYRLAYGIRVSTTKPRASWFTLVDANTGEVLLRLNQARSAISGNVTMQVHTTLPTDPLVARKTRNMTINVGSAVAVTDSNGFYTANPPGSMTVSAMMKGPYADVIPNNGITRAQFTSPVVTNPTTVNIAWTTSNSSTPERDAFYHANVAHDYVKRIDPSYTANDVQIPFQISDNLDECSSWWDFGAGSIYFYDVGSTCPNLATLPDIIYHEYGHSVNDKLYFFMGSTLGMVNNALQEGLADTYAAFISADPVIGQGYFGPGTFLRTLANTRRWPEDGNPDPHEAGLILGGALWDLRGVLGATITDRITHFALYGVPDNINDGEAFQQFFIKILIADDTDADLSNGTPHMTQIVNAFNAHGIGTNYFLGITHAPLEDQPTAGPYPVTSTFTYGAPFGGLSGGTLYWSNTAGASWNGVPMFPTGNPDEWGAEIPAQAQTVVRYYIQATDDQGGVRNNPGGAPSRKWHSFVAGPASTVFLHTFEVSSGWSPGATGDNATTGIWTRVDPNGTQCQSENDHTSDPGVMCYVTGQGSVGGFPGEADVDGGKTTLLTPIFDGTSGGFNQVISFYRWFSNDTGDYPREDAWKIDISNNGGSTWVPVENTLFSDLEWRRVVFKISQYVPPTSTMRMRFIAEDVLNPSLVEAGIDDFELRAFPPAVGVDEGSGAGSLALGAPRPNPFRSTTQFRYTLPEAGRVSLQVYDVEGRSIRNLIDGEVPAGNHSVAWDGRDDRGRTVSAGPYFVKLAQAGRGTSQAVVVIR